MLFNIIFDFQKIKRLNGKRDSSCYYQFLSSSDACNAIKHRITFKEMVLVYSVGAIQQLNAGHLINVKGSWKVSLQKFINNNIKSKNKSLDNLRYLLNTCVKK